MFESMCPVRGWQVCLIKHCSSLILYASICSFNDSFILMAICIAPSLTDTKFLTLLSESSSYQFRCIITLYYSYDRCLPSLSVCSFKLHNACWRIDHTTHTKTGSYFCFSIFKHLQQFFKYLRCI